MQPLDDLEDLIKRLSSSVPEPLKNAQEDMEQTMRGLLEGGLQKMNLVTREEFDIQTAVLERTRQKLDELEAKIKELEERL